MTRLALIAACLLLLTGCKSSQKVQGGTAKRDTGGFVLTYYPPGGGVANITDKRETVATTQPSFTGAGDRTRFSSLTAEEGQIGGFTLDTENFPKTATSWGLIGFLIVLGIACYFVRSWIGVAGCIAGVVIGLIMPAVLVWFGIAVLILLVYSQRKVVSQLVKGNQRAIKTLPREQAEHVKDEWEKAQDGSVKEVVTATKAKL